MTNRFRIFQKPWTLVVLLWLVCILNYTDRFALSTLFSVLKTEFSLSATKLGLLGTVFGVSYALVAPLAGRIIDRTSRKLAIVGSLSAWSLLTALLGLAQGWFQLIGLRILLGVSQTFYFPAAMSILGDYHGEKTRSRAMGFHQTGVYLGTIGSGAVVGWLALHFGWRNPLLLLGAAGLVVGFLLAWLIKEPKRQEVEGSDKDGRGLKPPVEPMKWSAFLGFMVQTPAARNLALTFCLANFVGLIFLTWMPSYLHDKFGLDLAKAGLGATIYLQLASIGGSSLGGYVADRWKKSHQGGRVLVQAIGLILGAPCIVVCGLTQELRVLVIAMTVFGLGKGLYESNIWAAIYDVVPRETRASVVGLMNMAAWLFGSLGPLAIGLAVDRGVSFGFALAFNGFLYLIGAGLLLFQGLVLSPRGVAVVR